MQLSSPICLLQMEFQKTPMQVVNLAKTHNMPTSCPHKIQAKEIVYNQKTIKILCPKMNCVSQYTIIFFQFVSNSKYDEYNIYSWVYTIEKYSGV